MGVIQQFPPEMVPLLTSANNLFEDKALLQYYESLKTVIHTGKLRSTTGNLHVMFSKYVEDTESVNYTARRNRFLHELPKTPSKSKQN
jgi:hypothetical protein